MITPEEILRVLDRTLDNIERRPEMHVGTDGFDAYETLLWHLLYLRGEILGKVSLLRDVYMEVNREQGNHTCMTLASYIGHRKRRRKDRMADLVKAMSELRKRWDAAP